MHRVELKAHLRIVCKRELLVPNAPCGVESGLSLSRCLLGCPVPNAPCGVESLVGRGWRRTLPAFLMHRVELKVPPLSGGAGRLGQFLMHRVELKDT